MALKQVGVDLAALNQAAFLRSMTGASGATNNFNQSLAQTIAQGNSMSRTIESTSKGLGSTLVASLQQAIAGFGPLATVTSLATSAFVSLGQTLASIPQKISQVVEFATNLNNTNEQIIQSATGVGGVWAQLGNAAIQTAGRIEQLNFVLYRVGGQHGLTSEEIDKQIEGIKALGITTAEAQNTVLQFIQSNLDLSKATELTRVAQDAAVISNSNSTETLGRLMRGIVTGQSEIVRYAGLQIDSLDILTKKQKEASKATGEQGAAAESASRQVAILNAILDKGKDVAGSYEASMQSANKQLGSLKRYQEELVRVIGEPFQKFFLAFVKAKTEFSKALYIMFEEGGALRPILEALGKALYDMWSNIEKVTKAFSDFAKSKDAEKLRDVILTIVNAVGEVYSAIIDTVTRVWNVLKPQLEKAKLWGQDFIKAFTDGIIGAAAYLVGGIQAIGDIITSLMAPGSPPAFLPSLVQWGADAATMYMSGWGQADLSVFNALAGDIKGILDTMVSAGTMEQKDLIPVFRQIREQMALLMNDYQNTGKITEDIMKKIAEMGGTAGTEVSSLTRLYLKQFTLTQQLENLQKRLTEAVTAYDEKLKSSLSELGKVQQARLSLQRKLERGRGTAADMNKFLALQKRESELQKDIVKTQEEKEAVIKAAQKQGEKLQEERSKVSEELSLRQAMLKMWGEENRLIQEQLKLLEKLGTAKEDEKDKAIPPTTPPELVLPELKFADKLKAQFDLQAANARQAILDFFTPLITLIKQIAAGDWAGAWETVKGIAISIWDKLKDEIIPNTVEWIAKALGMSPEDAAILKEKVAWYLDEVSLAVLQASQGNWTGAWATVADISKHFLMDIGFSEKAATEISTEIEWYLNKITDTVKAALGGDWETVWKNLTDVATRTWDNIKPVLEKIKNWALEKWAEFKTTDAYKFFDELVKTLGINKVVTDFGIQFDNIKRYVDGFLGYFTDKNMLPAATTPLQDLQALAKSISDVSRAFSDLTSFIQTHFPETVAGLNSMSDAFTALQIALGLKPVAKDLDAGAEGAGAAAVVYESLGSYIRTFIKLMTIALNPIKALESALHNLAIVLHEIREALKSDALVKPMEKLGELFEKIAKGVTWAAAVIGTFSSQASKDLLKDLPLPDWFTSLLAKSPPPLAVGVKLTTQSMKELQTQVRSLAATGVTVAPPMSPSQQATGASYSSTQNSSYNLQLQTVTPEHNVIRDFNLMRALAW